MVKVLVNEIINTNKVLLFVVLCVIVGCLAYYHNNILLSNDVYIDSLSEKMEVSRIENQLSIIRSAERYSYLFIPFIYLVKFALMTVVLLSGTLLFNYKIDSKKLFNIVLVAEFIFLLSPIYKIIHFELSNESYTYHDVTTFFPLSIFMFIDVNSVPIWLIYPLHVFNVFELAYVLILSYGLMIALDERYVRMLKIIFLTYGTSLLLWISFVVFLTLN